MRRQDQTFDEARAELAAAVMTLRFALARVLVTSRPWRWIVHPRASHGQACPCGWVAWSRYRWVIDVRGWLHDAFATPRLRRLHRRAERETRARLGLPPHPRDARH